MTRTLVSVITISFMDPDGLRKTTQSVDEQIGAFDLQHIVVDGGSPGVQDFLLQRKSKNPNFIGVSEPDCGRYHAMNKGIDLAAGDLLWFMHSGDVFSNERSIATALGRLKDPVNQWGYGYARLVDQFGEFHGAFGHAPFSLKRYSLGGKSIPHQAAFFGRAVIDRVGGYDLSHGLAADQLYMLRTAVRSDPVIVPEFLCNFDISGVGTNRPAWHHFRDMSRARKIAKLQVVNPVVDFTVTVGLTVAIILKDALAKYARRTRSNN
ncbi:MAG: glycosyltransferase [Alcaligenaceae bacterium]|nr:MAG: glycosyltransferase [Alcaligenaceae bacterium]